MSNELVVFSLVELVLSQEVVCWPVARSIKSTRKRQETYYTHTLSTGLQVSTGSRVASGFAVALRCPLNWLFSYLACTIREVLSHWILSYLPYSSCTKSKLPVFSPLGNFKGNPFQEFFVFCSWFWWVIFAAMREHHQQSGQQNRQKKRSKKRINGAASSACCGGWWPSYAVSSAFRGVGRCMYVGCFPIVRCLGLDDCRHHHHKHFHWEWTNFVAYMLLAFSYLCKYCIAVKIGYESQNIQKIFPFGIVCEVGLYSSSSPRLVCML